MAPRMLMDSFALPLSERIRRWTPLRRRLLMMAADLALIFLAVWLSFALRIGQFWPAMIERCSWLFLATWLIGPLIYIGTGQYKGISRYSGSRALYALALRNLLVVALLYILQTSLALPEPPRSGWLLLWILLTGLSGGFRLLLRDLLQELLSRSSRHPQLRALIYGAGSAGVQLAASLRYGRNHRVIGFLDDEPSLWGRHINGLRVGAPAALATLIQKKRIDQILLAMPSINQQRRRQIIDGLQAFGIPVLQVPSVEEITSGRTRIDALRPIAIEELLSRDPVAAQPQLLRASVAARCVLVSGAGGSIGSELCRQIVRLEPSCLILLENSEAALFSVEQQLHEQLAEQTTPPLLQVVLGSVDDRLLLKKLFSSQRVHTVFHAAAYKHVPLVELNPLVGLANNVLGTRSLLLSAIEHRVECFVLISTDKAVRPTNVMGASKRLAEQLVQATALEQQAQPAATRCAIVRFGNVLGSSGSVVPLFRHQIARGGPITLTHPEIIRYFMTIPEAVQLVLQASSLAEGGDCFLLDMGKPVRILDLARQMVVLSGLSVRDADNPQGDIEILCTGLRPGEKLYEELLIEASSIPTAHPRIHRAQESCLPPEVLWPLVASLERALQHHDEAEALALLARLVPEWQQHGRAQPAPGRLAARQPAGP